MNLLPLRNNEMKLQITVNQNPNLCIQGAKAWQDLYPAPGSTHHETGRDAFDSHCSVMKGNIHFPIRLTWLEYFSCVPPLSKLFHPPK